jgi:putative cell wall-binding protein
LAAARNAPLLFASGSTLPAVTRAEVQRVLPRGKTIYLLGGSASIPDTVVTQLTGLGYVAVRLAGTNRFGTAVAVANELGAPSTALLASADGFADALTAGPAAAHVHGAILLTTDGSVGPETAAYLAAHPGTVYAIGGPAARADPAAEAIAGSDRFATATMVATKFFVAAQAVGVANGLAFPDALAAGAFLGRAGEPLLLTSPAVLTDVTRGYLSPGNGRTTIIFGGNSAVSSQSFDAISAVLGG